MGRTPRLVSLTIDAGPVLVVALVIFTLSSFPLRLPPRSPVWSDKAMHLALFGALAATLLRLWVRRGWPSAAAATVGLTFLYGLSDELHQALVPGRSPDWRDLLTDTVAAVLVVAAFGVARRARGREAAGDSPAARTEELAARD